ncbi:sodium-dependent noradrenaline transporter-like [Ostrinia furnacalis]|uniref:sodium-dependent noradrenaline transporter-like n=1 Tax=Ostrinia furnacalis TaxID=93504 RepID=UPI00103F86B1|nr:sodium-dependent noradrenaline transporter-like [Ostrinia furnacalis]
MFEVKKSVMDIKYTPDTSCRWKSYGNYRMIIWAWMVNEVGLMLIATDISHSGFYIYAMLHILSVIFIGIPLIYSEICLSQYTNNGVISIWNFLPILRPVGYVFGVIIELVIYYRHGMIREVFTPSEDWGPSDRILFKSRNMFVPEIMTREFLYRQVRIHGYSRRQKAAVRQKQIENLVTDSSSDGTEWSAMTSN